MFTFAFATTLAAPPDPIFFRDMNGRMVDLAPAIVACGAHRLRVSRPIEALGAVKAARAEQAADRFVVLIVEDPVSDGTAVRAWLHVHASDLPIVLDPMGALRWLALVSPCPANVALGVPSRKAPLPQATTPVTDDATGG